MKPPVTSEMKDKSLPLPDRELCFKPSSLIDGSISNIADFIADLRMHAPLSVIRDDLRALLEAVQAELVTCVQRDFSAFVALGPSIADCAALADAALEPLETLRKELTALLSGLDGEIETLSATLEERRKVADRAEALRVLLRANDLLHKCERLLKDYKDLGPACSDALQLIERIAGEYAQLSFTLSRAGNGAFVRSISVRVSVVRRSIRTHLEAWLRRALFPREAPSDGSPYDVDILRRVLEAFVVAGIGADAEEFFRREIVAPFTNTRVRMTPMLAIAEKEKRSKSGTPASSTIPPSGSSSDRTSGGEASGTSSSGSNAGSTETASLSGDPVTAADALEVTERVIVQFLGDRVMPLTSLCQTEERLKSRLDFVGNAAWPQIAKAISSNMASAFSPGTPDVFHQSVLSGTRLYAAAEAALISDSQVDALRKSPTTVDFWRLWNLPVYFQLRFQEITSKFDADLQRGPVTPDPAAAVAASGRLLRSDMYGVQATVGMVDALRTCWSGNVYLKPLAHRFLRLSLQLITRYVTWVRTGLAGEWAGGDSMTAGAARVHADLVMVQERVPAEFASMLRMRDTGIESDLVESIDAALSEAVASLGIVLPELSRSISDALSILCVENLRPMRGILATFRVSSKPAPTTHSPLVPKVLRQLKSFLNEQRGRLGPTTCTEVATAVCEATAEKYYEMATDLLSSNKKSEEALRRLNLGRGVAAAGANSRAGTKTDKVSLQLYLDVAKFRDEVAAVGVDLDKVLSMAKLWECVRRKDSDEEGKSEEKAEVDLQRVPEGAAPVGGDSATSPGAKEPVPAVGEATSVPINDPELSTVGGARKDGEDKSDLT